MATRMNILIISYEYPPIGGGVGTSLLYYMQSLKNTEHTVDIIVPCDTAIFDVMQITDKITIKPVMIAKKKRYQWTKTEMALWLWNIWLECVVERKKYDVIHYWGPFPAIYAPIMRNKNTPYIITFHGADVPGRHKRFNKMYKFMVGYKRLCKKASYCTAVTDALAYKAEFWMNKSVEIISNGIKTHRTQTAICENKLVTMSRLVPWKRVCILINAMKYLPDDYTLDIYGNGPEYIRLYDLARSVCPNRITFRGWVNWSDSLLPMYKIYVQASSDLGVSNISELEALGYGLPVVRVEYIGTEPFKDAVVASMSLNPEELAKKILMVSNNYDHHRKAVAYIRGVNSWARSTAKYLALCERATNERKE